LPSVSFQALPGWITSSFQPVCRARAPVNFVASVALIAASPTASALSSGVAIAASSSCVCVRPVKVNSGRPTVRASTVTSPEVDQSP
jgi:hypothetical protein